MGRRSSKKASLLPASAKLTIAPTFLMYIVLVLLLVISFTVDCTKEGNGADKVVEVVEAGKVAEADKKDQVGGTKKVEEADEDDYEDDEDDDDDDSDDDDDDEDEMPVVEEHRVKPNTKDPNYLMAMRPKLGHFKRLKWQGVENIYESYHINVTLVARARRLRTLKKSVTTREPDGVWTSARPKGSDCVTKLLNFKQNNYVLNRPYDIIQVDACLEWLFPDENDDIGKDWRAVDEMTLSTSLKNEIPGLEKNEKLKEIYTKTFFKRNRIKRRKLHKLVYAIYDYLMRLMGIHRDHSSEGCHSLWMEAYDDFIEDVYLKDCNSAMDCEKPFGYRPAKRDSYLQLIIGSTKKAAENCYKFLVEKNMGVLKEERWRKDNTIKNKLRKWIGETEVKKQMNREQWTGSMLVILQMVQNSGPTDIVELATVAHNLQKIKDGDTEYMNNFLESLSTYTDRQGFKSSTDNEYGQASYARAMIHLCSDYVDRSTFMGSLLGDENEHELVEYKDRFEVYHIINSLIRLTHFVPLISKTKENLEKEILSNRWESLYLVTFTCQIVAATWAEVKLDTNEEKVDVTLRTENFNKLVKNWPIDIIVRELVAKPIEDFQDIEEAIPKPNIERKNYFKRFLKSLHKMFHKNKKESTPKLQESTPKLQESTAELEK